MADRYWVGGSGNWSDATNHWATLSGGAPGAGNLPTSADNAIFDGASNAVGYTVTIDATIKNCLNFQIGNPASGVITFAGSVNINVFGNYSNPAGAVLNASGTLTFSAASGTKTITSNGVSITWGMAFAGSGIYQLQDALTCIGNNFSQSTGTFDPNGFNVTLSTQQGTIAFAGGANAMNFAALTITNRATKTDAVNLAGNVVAASLTANANSVTNRLFIGSNTAGTIRTITITGPNPPTLSNINFRDITAGGGSPSAPWTGTSIGDCGGNSNITATPAATQTYLGGDAAFTWSTAAWTSRVPLPQDNVVISQAFTGSKTMTLDMPHLGKDIDWSGSSGSFTVTHAATFAFYGSWKQCASMTNTGATGISAFGRSSHTIRSAGVAWAAALNLNGNGSTYTLEDALSLGVNVGLSVNMGTFADAGFSVTAGTIAVVAAGTVVKSGNWEVLGATFSNVGTWTSTGGYVKMSEATAATKTFTGGGNTYSRVWFAGAGTGFYQIDNANNLGDLGTLSADANRDLRFTAGKRVNVTTYDIATGCIIGSITAANHTLSKTGGGKVKLQGVTVSRSTAQQTFTFYAFNGSTDGGNNVNWNFYNPDYTLALDPLSFALSMKATNILVGRRLVCESLIFSFQMKDARPLAGRRIGLDPFVFSLTLGAIRLADLYHDPRYVISGSPRTRSIGASRSRSVGGTRTRTIYKRD